MHNAIQVLAAIRAQAPHLPVVVRTQSDRHLDRLRAAGATEVVPEAHEGSLMLAGHALALTGVPMRRVVRLLREQREQRYQLLRGYFRGANDASEDTLDEDHLKTFTVPEALAGRRLAELLADAGELRAVSLQRRSGAPAPADDDAPLQGGETVVLSGKAAPLARAEKALTA